MKNKILRLTILILMYGSAGHAQSWSLTGNKGTDPSTDFLGTINKKSLVVRTNNIERLRIKSNGNIGIGTSSPQALLSIINSSLFSLSDPGAFLIGDQTATNMAFDYQNIQARYDGQGATLKLNPMGGSTALGSYNGTVFPALWTNDDGRVGIGTNYALAAGFALTVDPILIGNGITINDPGNGYSLYTAKSGSQVAAIHVEALHSYYAAIEAFTDNAQRAIYGEDYLNGNGVEGRSYGGNAVVGVSTINVGILGIAPAYAGYFDGDVYASGTYFGSDQKLKQNIKDFSGAMEIINQLHPKYYEYRHDDNYKLMNLPGGEHYGLIAQDVEKVLPNLVKETKFDTRYASPNEADAKHAEIIDFKALNYTELIPILIKAIQEQQQQIDDLRQSVQTLSADPSFVSKSTEQTRSAYLEQNSPNPFSENTVIRFHLLPSLKEAQLVICTADGKQVRSYALSGHESEITIDADTLSPGEYTYSLFIEGKTVDSKHMILIK